MLGSEPQSKTACTKVAADHGAGDLHPQVSETLEGQKGSAAKVKAQTAEEKIGKCDQDGSCTVCSRVAGSRAKNSACPSCRENK